MKYYSVIKTNELRTHAITWMNLKNIILSEGHQTQKTKYYIIPIIIIPREGKTKDLQSTSVIAQELGWGWGEGLCKQAQRNFLGWWKGFKTGRWWCLYNCMNSLKFIELYTHMGWVSWSINFITIKLLKIYPAVLYKHNIMFMLIIKIIF